MSFLSPWVQLGLTAGNAVGGALSGRRGARTSSYNRSSSQSSSTSGVTTRRRTLRPEQEEALGLLSSRIRQMLTTPEAGLKPLRLAQRTGVNRTFAAAPTALAARFLRSGQPSGKFGRAARETELARLGSLANVDTAFAGLSLEREDSALNLAERLLSQDFESTIGTSSTGTVSGTASGTGVAPGSALGGAVSGGLEALSTLMMINRILQGGA